MTPRHRSDPTWHSSPLGTLPVVKSLSPSDYSVGRRFSSTRSKIKTSRHRGSHKGRTPGWHGDSRNNGNNGLPKLGGGLCRSSSHPSVSSCFVLPERRGCYCFSKVTSHRVWVEKPSGSPDAGEQNGNEWFLSSDSSSPTDKISFHWLAWTDGHVKSSKEWCLYFRFSLRLSTLEPLFDGTVWSVRIPS